MLNKESMDSASPSDLQHTCSFLELAPELRSIVYDEALLSCYSTKNDDKYLPSILSVSRQIYYDVLGKIRDIPAVVNIKVGGGITFDPYACHFYWYEIHCGECEMRFEKVDEETEFERKVQNEDSIECVDVVPWVPRHYYERSSVNINISVTEHSLAQHGKIANAVLRAVVEFVDFWGMDGHDTQKAVVIISCKAEIASLLDDAATFSSVLDKSFSEHTLEIKPMDF